MAAVAHSPEFAKKAGVPQSVGRDFNEADKGRKFAKGGNTMATMNPKMAAIMAAKAKMQGAGGGMPPPAAGGGMPPPGMKKGGKTEKYADGGAVGVAKRNMPTAKGVGSMMMAKGGQAKKDGAPRQEKDSGRIDKATDDKRFAKGGYVRDADGVAQKGKTRGKFI